jgi:lipopolysaccharide export system permease protein
VFIAALLTMALTYLCGLHLMPLGQRLMKDKVLDIRADIGTAIFNPGEFNTPVKGLTVFIRDLTSDGDIAGVLVHDNRNARRPITYLAEGGQLVQTPVGARLIMSKGTIEQSDAGGARLSMLKFDRYVFDLDQFASPQRFTERAASERYLSELFRPDPKHLTEKARAIYLAEGHNRLAAPLYCLTFALIALAAVTRGRRGRGAHALRLTIASLLAVGLRIAGYGLQGFTANHAFWNILLYLLPVLGGLAALAVLMGFDPEEMLQRRRAAAVAEATA